MLPVAGTDLTSAVMTMMVTEAVTLVGVEDEVRHRIMEGVGDIHTHDLGPGPTHRVSVAHDYSIKSV